MKRAVTSSQMQLFDTYTQEELLIPSQVLMERAALAVVSEIENSDLHTERIICVCGNGNNGGDGIAIARILFKKGYYCDIFLTGDESHMTDQTKEQKKIAKRHKVPFVNPEDVDFEDYTLIVDAIFGVGLSRPLTGEYVSLVRRISHASADVLSVDVPSGVDAATGKVLGAAVFAHTTVTFEFMKVGLILHPGMDHAGRVVVSEIGISENTNTPPVPDIHLLEKKDLSLIPPRVPLSNKSTYGRIFLIAGSPSMAGACYLSALAAFRMGAGMVKIYTAVENRDILMKLIPEAMISVYYGDDIQTSLIDEGLRWADVLGIGPGMSTDDNAKEILWYVMEHNSLPMVADADAINILSENMALLREYQGKCIITPHLGEMARLTRMSAERIRTDIVVIAAFFAEEYGVQCVLKDARTVTACPNGSMYINLSGNDGMATAGSGDVLTGIILGLLARGVDFDMAGALGAYIHGLAGDKARDKYGASYMMASDIIESLNIFGV